MALIDVFHRAMYCLGVFVACNVPTVAGVVVCGAIRRRKERRNFERAARKAAMLVMVAGTGGRPGNAPCRAYDQEREAGYAAYHSGG